MKIIVGIVERAKVNVLFVDTQKRAHMKSIVGIVERVKEHVLFVDT